MILVDTSVWADHFRKPEPTVSDLLRRGQVMVHGFVIGEIAVGSLADWEGTVAALSALPRVTEVSEGEWRETVLRHRLYGSGLGFVDCHLLASLERSEGVQLWARDRRLNDAAQRMSVRAILD